MSPLRPKFLLNLLVNYVPALPQGQPLKHAKRRQRTMTDRLLFKASCTLLALGSLLSAEAAQAVDFVWSSTAPGGNVWPGPGVQTAAFQQAGVTLNFDFTGDFAVTQGFSPTLGNELDTLIPGNINFPVDGAQANGNLFLANDPDDVTQSLTLTVNATNAAGNAVPLEQVTYTIIDVDRSCNRIDGPPTSGPNLPPNAAGELFWQDVISNRFLQGANGVTPTTVSTGETVEALGVGVGAGTVNYTVPANALTFRGILDPTAETLSNALGNDGCSGNPDANFGGNDDNRGVEAANNSAQGDATEGNITLSSGANAVTGIEFRYGTGVLASPANGLPGETLAPNPQGHGLGVLSDFSFSPGIIGVAKDVTSVVDNGDGSFNITYSVRVENLGETALSNVQLDDNLIAPGTGIVNNTFSPTAGSDPFTIFTAPASADGLILNPTYDGGNTTPANAQLLGAGNTLAVGEANTLTYTLQVTPGTGSTLRYDTQVSATGNTPNGGITTDISNDGATVEDGAGDNDPTSDRSGGVDFPVNATTTAANGGTVAIGGPNAGDETVTVAVLPALPRIGVTKQVVGIPIPVGPGIFDVTYRQIVRNQGNVPLSAVQLTEDLDATFRTAGNGVTSFVVQPGIASPAANPIAGTTGYRQLVPDATFNGTGTQGLLDAGNATNALDPGEFGVVDFVVRVTPGANLGDGPDATDPPYDGTVTATGTFVPGGGNPDVPVSDLSDDRTLFGDGAVELPNDLNADGDTTDGSAGDGTPGPSTTTNPINVTSPANQGTENDPTPVAFGQPAIALSKRVTDVTANPDGTFNVTYRQLVQNIGSVPLDNVQITEDASIADTFRVSQANGATATTVLSVTPVAPTGANGVTLTAGSPAALEGSNTLLTGADTLQPGEFGEVDYVVRVTPGNNTEGYGGNGAPFSSQATATGSATSLGGAIVMDPSDDGVEFPNGSALAADPAQTLDPDGNGNANEGAQTLEPIDADGNTITTATQASENNPTPVRFPEIAVSRAISDVTGSGTAASPYIVTYDVTVQNVGGIRLNNIQITEQSIDDVFNDLTPSGNATIVAPPVQTGGIATTPNSAFDGETVLGLIDPAALLTLEPEESSTLQYQVQLEGPVESPTRVDPYDSSSTASGTGIPSDANGPIADNPLVVTGDANADGILEPPAATGILPVSDLSDDGTNPDPITTDGNRGGGPGEDDPTGLTFPIGPQIGLTKQVISTTPVPGQPGSFDVTFEYRVQNIGIVPLNGLDITDNYDTQFDIGEPTAVTNYEVISVTPGAAEIPGGPTLVGNAAAVGSAPNSGNLSIATGNATQFDPGQAATTQVVVRVTPQASQLATVFDGTALASGTSTVDPTQTDTDISDDIPPVGATDPRVITPSPGILGEGTATISAADATPVVFDLAVSGLQLFKTITFTSRTGAITTQLPGAPAGVLGTAQVPDELQSGDIVEYSIYFFNNAATVFPGLEICDALPSPLSPVLPIAGGSFINALTPLPLAGTTGRSCPDGTSGTQGAVIFPVGDVAASSNGSVVFRTQIQ